MMTIAPSSVALIIRRLDPVIVSMLRRGQVRTAVLLANGLSPLEKSLLLRYFKDEK